MALILGEDMFGARPADATSIGCRSGWSGHQPIECGAWRLEGR